MTFSVTFFCRTQNVSVDQADQALETALKKRCGSVRFMNSEAGEGWISFEPTIDLAESASPDLSPTRVEIHADEASIRPTILSFEQADDISRIASSDLMIVITLIGDSPDWDLLRALWSAIDELWEAVTYSDGEGFEMSINSL